MRNRPDHAAGALSRRHLLQTVGVAAVMPAVMPNARPPAARPGGPAKTIVMIHGAFAGAWCFEPFRRVFEGLGWTVHTPDLRGHGVGGRDGAALAGAGLAGVGLADYRADLTSLLRSFPEPPVLLGHSMGGVLAQQLASDGFARALVLVAPAARAGILPSAETERAAAKGLMTLGAFWSTVVQPNFEVASGDSLNRVPEAGRRAVFERFGPESGRALFELFFWMLDGGGASAVAVETVRCPVLCLSGSDDRVVSPATARATAAGFREGAYREVDGHGHMVVVEPGAETVARTIAAWLPD